MNFDNVIAERKNKKIYVDGDRVYKVFNEDFSKAKSQLLRDTGP